MTRGTLSSRTIIVTVPGMRVPGMREPGMREPLLVLGAYGVVTLKAALEDEDNAGAPPDLATAAPGGVRRGQPGPMLVETARRRARPAERPDGDHSGRRRRADQARRRRMRSMPMTMSRSA